MVSRIAKCSERSCDLCPPVYAEKSLKNKNKFCELRKLYYICYVKNKTTMTTKRLKITNTSNDYPHNWLGILPFINIQHKYWYLWNINFGWLWGDWTIEILRRDWRHKGNFDDSDEN